LNVFYPYAHRDERQRIELDKQLAPLCRGRQIATCRIGKLSAACAKRQPIAAIILNNWWRITDYCLPGMYVTGLIACDPLHSGRWSAIEE